MTGSVCEAKLLLSEHDLEGGLIRHETYLVLPCIRVGKPGFLSSAGVASVREANLILDPHGEQAKTIREIRHT